MLFARAGHAATLLLLGKFLVTGGINNGDYLSSCELYDPSSNKWSVVASMSLSRIYQTASLLSSGKVLVASGSTQPLGEVYDPSSDTWSPVDNPSVAHAVQEDILLSSA